MLKILPYPPTPGEECPDGHSRAASWAPCPPAAPVTAPAGARRVRLDPPPPAGQASRFHCPAELDCQRPGVRAAATAHPDSGKPARPSSAVGPSMTWPGHGALLARVSALPPPPIRVACVPLHLAVHLVSSGGLPGLLAVRVPSSLVLPPGRGSLLPSMGSSGVRAVTAQPRGTCQGCICGNATLPK